MWKEAWWCARARTNPDRPCSSHWSRPSIRSPLAPSLRCADDVFQSPIALSRAAWRRPPPSSRRRPPVLRPPPFPNCTNGGSRGHRAPVAWEKWGGRRNAYARSASFYPIAPVDHAARPWFFHSRRHTDLSGRDFPRPRPLFRILAWPPSLLKARQTGNLSLAKVSNCGYNWVKQVESAFLFILQVRSVLWL